jgi:hypothetical protein
VISNLYANSVIFTNPYKFRNIKFKKSFSYDARLYFMENRISMQHVKAKNKIHITE